MLTLPDAKSSQRWQMLVSFVDGYFKQPIDEASGDNARDIVAAQDRIGVSFPVAVAEWFRLVGNRSDVSNASDFSIRLSDLTVQDGFLSLYCESQALWECGVRTADFNSPDPPAYFRSNELDYVEDYGLDESLVHQGVVEIAHGVSHFLTYMVILQRIIGTLNASCDTAWRNGITYGPLTELGIAKDASVQKLFVAPWGHSVCRHKYGFFDSRTRQYIANLSDAMDGLGTPDGESAT